MAADLFPITEHRAWPTSEVAPEIPYEVFEDLDRQIAAYDDELAQEEWEASEEWKRFDRQVQRDLRDFGWYR